MLLIDMEEEMDMCFFVSFVEYLINKAARMFSKSSRKSYFGKESIGTL